MSNENSRNFTPRSEGASSGGQGGRGDGSRRDGAPRNDFRRDDRQAGGRPEDRQREGGRRPDDRQRDARSDGGRRDGGQSDGYRPDNRPKQPNPNPPRREDQRPPLRQPQQAEQPRMDQPLTDVDAAVPEAPVVAPVVEASSEAAAELSPAIFVSTNAEDSDKIPAANVQQFPTLGEAAAAADPEPEAAEPASTDVAQTDESTTVLPTTGEQPVVARRKRPTAPAEKPKRPTATAETSTAEKAKPEPSNHFWWVGRDLDTLLHGGLIALDESLRDWVEAYPVEALRVLRGLIVADIVAGFIMVTWALPEGFHQLQGIAQDLVNKLVPQPGQATEVVATPDVDQTTNTGNQTNTIVLTDATFEPTFVVPTQVPLKEGVIIEQRTYTVVEGDTLNEIATKLGVLATQLEDLNDIQNVDLIYPGQLLTYYVFVDDPNK